MGQVRAKPKATVLSGTLIHGDMSISVWIMGKERMQEMKMVMGTMKSK